MDKLKDKKLLQSSLDAKQKDKVLYQRAIKFLNLQKEKVISLNELNQLDMINRSLDMLNDKLTQIDAEIETLKNRINNCKKRKLF